MFVGIPIRKCWKFLRDSLEEANDHAHRCGFHVITEFVNRYGVLPAVSKHNFQEGEMRRLISRFTATSIPQWRPYCFLRWCVIKNSAERIRLETSAP